MYAPKIAPLNGFYTVFSTIVYSPKITFAKFIKSRLF